MTFDAVIVGGGPAGATAAILLAQAGWSVAIVEKSTFPRRKVCGEFISATTLPLLHELGIGDVFLATAGPQVRRVGLFAGETMVDSAMPRVRGSRDGWGRALGRERLDALMLDAATRAGARLWQPWSASVLRHEADGYTCRIETKGVTAELCGRIVIAAHGSWERGTLPTQIVRAHRRSDLLAFKAHFTGAELPGDLMPLLVFPGGYGGMVHSDGGRVTLSCCIRRDVLENCRRGDPGHTAAQAVLRHIEASCAGVRCALRTSSMEGPWLSAGPIRPGIRKRYASGVFRAGNIAGEAHPIVAEGISMAMQSAWLLCRHLIAMQDDLLSGRALDEAGRLYAAEWRTAFATRVRAASIFAELAMRPNAAALWLPAMRRFPQLLKVGARLSGKARQVVPAT